MTTATTDRIHASLAFTLKRKQDNGDDDNNDDDDDDDDDAYLSDTDDLSPFSLPSISVNEANEYNDGFLRLSAMVRAVYLSYLRECLLSNYMTCCKEKDDSAQSVQVNKCADQMELNAVRSALETGLYRRNMLRMIADIKSYTVQKKPYKKLIRVSSTPDDKINVAVQTDDTWINLHETNSTEDACVRPDHEELSRTATLSAMRSDDFNVNEEIVKGIDDEAKLETTVDQESYNIDHEIMDLTHPQIMDDNTGVKNEEDDSRDSLLRHMEDMFCESDDSSDLTRLIEKHSNVTKASIDREISELCLETADANVSQLGLPRSNDVAKCRAPRTASARGKLTYSRYKEMRNKAAAETTKEMNGCETLEEKRKRRLNAIWFVERVHQVSKLRTKMTELSLTNYRKHGRVKEKFLHLFGSTEQEEMMPDSPICIEEHLPACKERIAPWIVRCLMPFYKKRRIKDRQLFKTVAKYIADMLIMKNTFPERECVSEYIESYFKNKKLIKTKQDVYL